MDARGPDSWRTARGTDREFAQLYESFLDAVYRPPVRPVASSGRRDLARSIMWQLRSRGARRVLDCAAGTGFPALDLAAAARAGVEIHCIDASLDMLTILLAQAKRRGVDIDRLAPRRPAIEQYRTGVDDLVFDWNDLSSIAADYDYVMCRGNSLAYASSWSIRQRDVASLDLIRDDLQQIVDRVRPGGHLHIDAPWRLDLPSSKYAPVVSGAVFIEEEVTARLDHRHWRLTVRLPTEQSLIFEKHSTLLTIFDVETMLDDMGFDRTAPLQLAGERRGLGVIIARKAS